MSALTIIPAVDLKGGQCVRLIQGRSDAEKVYNDDPVAVARHWVAEGATYLHVVDLDGAFSGQPAQLDLVIQIIKAVAVPVQAGGGLRSDADIQRLIDAGADRVVLGTRAWSEPDQLRALVKKFGARLAVGIDARDGRIQVRGWTETTGKDAIAFAKEVDAIGVKTLIVTDTATDGMMKGVNAKFVGAVSEAVTCSVIASGGVASPKDILALRKLNRSNITGVIVGRALYEGRVRLKELLEASR